MAKRFLCLILAVILTFSCLLTGAPVAQAEENPFVILRVWQGEYRNLQVIPRGDDFLFSIEDLAWMSNTKAAVTGTQVRFTRGAKTVTVQLYDENLPEDSVGLVAAIRGTNSKKLLTASQSRNGTHYLSGASLLPWLNVRFHSDGQILRVHPSTGSLWDLLPQLDLESYQFDFVNCCKELGISSKDVRAAAYIRNNGLKSLLDLDINNNGRTYQSTENYTDLFDDYFKDKSATDQHFEATRQDVALFQNLTDAGTIAFLTFAPEFAVATKILSNIASSAQRAMDYCVYITLFDQDNSQKLRIMESFSDGQLPNDISLDKNMMKAAEKIQERYTSLWKGIMQMAVSDVVDFAVDQLDSLYVMKLLNLKWNVERPLNEQVARIALYETISDAALSVCRDPMLTYSEEELIAYIDNAALHLYCVEQNYRAMAQYMTEKHAGDSTLLKSYLHLADEAEAAAARLLDISAYTSYDASDIAKWNTQSKELQKLFGSIETQTATDQVGAFVDNAVYLSALREMNFPNLQWTEADLDRDGIAEVLATGVTGSDFDRTHYCVAMDANQQTIAGLDFFSTQPGKYALTPSTDGVSYYPKFGFESGNIWRWTGTEWSPVLGWDEGYLADIFMEFNYVNGQRCTYDEYVRMRDSLMIDEAASDAQLDCPMLDDRLLEGDCASLISRIADHLKGKSSHLYSTQLDLNDDGISDNVSVLRYALGEELLFARENADPDTQQPHLSWLDLDWTVVVAESDPQGARLRVCRIDEAYVQNVHSVSIDHDSKSFTLNGTTFSYHSNGAAFRDSSDVVGGGVYLLDLLSADAQSAQNLVDGFFEADDTYLSGELGGGSVTMTFLPDGTVETLAFWPNPEQPANINTTLHTAMVRREIWEKLQPSTPWDPPAPATDPEGNVLYYGTDFIYTHSGVPYRATIGFYHGESDSPIKVISFVRAS